MWLLFFSLLITFLLFVWFLWCSLRNGEEGLKKTGTAGCLPSFCWRPSLSLPSDLTSSRSSDCRQEPLFPINFSARLFFWSSRKCARELLVWSWASYSFWIRGAQLIQPTAGNKSDKDQPSANQNFLEQAGNRVACLIWGNCGHRLVKIFTDCNNVHYKGNHYNWLCPFLITPVYFFTN